MNETELKALAYDQVEQMENIRNNLLVINQQIAKVREKKVVKAVNNKS